MSAYFTITRNPDPLTQERWSFHFFDDRMMIVLDAYQKAKRPSSRHRRYEADAEDQYVRLSDRYAKMTEDQVPMPEDVLVEARLHIIKQIRVGLWNRDYCKKG